MISKIPFLQLIYFNQIYVIYFLKNSYTEIQLFQKQN